MVVRAVLLMKIITRGTRYLLKKTGVWLWTRRRPRRECHQDGDVHLDCI